MTSAGHVRLGCPILAQQGWVFFRLLRFHLGACRKIKTALQVAKKNQKRVIPSAARDPSWFKCGVSVVSHRAKLLSRRNNHRIMTKQFFRDISFAKQLISPWPRHAHPPHCRRNSSPRSSFLFFAGAPRGRGTASGAALSVDFDSRRLSHQPFRCLSKMAADGESGRLWIERSASCALLFRRI